MKWISIKNKMDYKDIINIMSKLQITLPEDYCKMIGKVNGGALQNAYYPHPQLGNIPYSRNLSLSENAKTTAMDLFEILNDNTKRYFPFGSVGNGDYFCFDLKNQNVVLYCHENDKYIYICDSFSEFINNIIEK